MNRKDPSQMTLNEFKREFRAASGWPNVKYETEDRQAIAEAEAKEKAMLEAGAALAKRGPGRPPKVNTDGDV